MSTAEIITLAIALAAGAGTIINAWAAMRRGGVDTRSQNLAELQAIIVNLRGEVDRCREVARELNRTIFELRAEAVTLRDIIRGNRT